MSDIITLEADDGLVLIRSELVYTKARLLAHPGVSHLAAPFDPLLTRWSLVFEGQLKTWDDEDIADAGVGAANDGLDDRVTLVINGIQFTFKKDDPVYTRFMGGDNKSGIVRLGLASQIRRVEGWPESLRGQASLAEHADPLISLIGDGRVALENRVKAQTARADYRIGEIFPFVDDANGLRRSTYHSLGQYAVDNKLPSNFPKRFFRTRPSRKRD